MELLKQLIEDKTVLYIYEIGKQIYGIFPDVKERSFLVIVDPEFTINDSIYIDGENTFNFIIIDEWFRMIQNCDILAWECACLPKKYVIKEYVKLLMKTDPLKLRMNYLRLYKKNYESALKEIELGNTLTAQILLWKITKYAIFANQILENHKIVNFKSVADDYRKIVDGQLTYKDDILKKFETANKKYQDDLMQCTYGVYLRHITALADKARELDFEPNN